MLGKVLDELKVHDKKDKDVVYALIELLKSNLSTQMQILKELQIDDKSIKGNLLYCVMSASDKNVIPATQEILGLETTFNSTHTKDLLKNDEIQKDHDFCASVIELVLDDVVNGMTLSTVDNTVDNTVDDTNEKDQTDLINKIETLTKREINILGLNENQRLELIQSVTPLEIEYINSLVFGIIEGDYSDEETLEFAETDYSDKITSKYLGHDKTEKNSISGRKYWNNEYYKENVSSHTHELDKYKNGKEGSAWFLKNLYRSDEEGEDLRKAVGLPKIEPDLFHKTVGLTLNYESKNSAVPMDKFYEVTYDVCPVSNVDIAAWLGLSAATGRVNSDKDNAAPYIPASRVTNFVENWCVDNNNNIWVGAKNNDLLEYLRSRNQLLKRNHQLLTYDNIVDEPLLKAIVVFEKLAKKFEIDGIQTLREMNSSHPLATLLENMQLAYMAVDNVCEAEEKNLGITWLNLIAEEYRKTLGTDGIIDNQTDVFISRICYNSRLNAMQNMISFDPTTTHPVYGVEIGQQLKSIYSDALNVPFEGLEMQFDIESGEACGTAEFVSPTAPNRVRAYNAGKSLNLGSIISVANEIVVSPNQQEKNAQMQIENKTLVKARTFEETVRVFDDKYLLLKSNELLLGPTKIKENETRNANEKHYYFGKPSEFNDSWTLRSRLQKLVKKLDAYFKENIPDHTELAEAFLKTGKLTQGGLIDWITNKVITEKQLKVSDLTDYTEYTALISEILTTESIQTTVERRKQDFSNDLMNANQDLNQANAVSDLQKPDENLRILLNNYGSEENQISSKDKLVTTIIARINNLKKWIEETDEEFEKNKKELDTLNSEKNKTAAKLGGKDRLDIIKSAEQQIKNTTEEIAEAIVYVLYTKLKDWIKNTSDNNIKMTLEELKMLLSQCASLYDENFDEVGLNILAGCKLDRFGSFVNDVLPLHLADEGYIGWSEKL